MTERNEIDKLYHSPAWQRARVHVLIRDHYLCQECKRQGVITRASTVHHKEHAKDNPERFFDEDNLESICKACHNKEHPEKTQRAINQYFAEKRRRIKNEKAKGIVVFEQNRPLY